MQSKEKSTKPDVPKMSVTAEVVAHVSNCSESYVNAIRRGIRRTNSETGQRIILAQALLEAGTEILITEIKKMLTPLE